MKKTKRQNPGQLIAAVLPQVAKEQGWQNKLEQHTVFSNWQKIVDQQVADCAAPLKIVQNVLWLEVENSAWMQQLQYQKLAILEAVNEFLPSSSLDDIRMVVKDQRQPEVVEETKVRFAAPPKEAMLAFENMATTITDERAREALIRFWYLCNACKRQDEEEVE